MSSDSDEHQRVARGGASKLPPRFWQTAGALAFLLFVSLNVVNALHKGGDFDVFLETGERALKADPLYTPHVEHSDPGIVGPPFQGMFFAPFSLVARASLPFARLLWFALNLAGLFGGAWLWIRAFGAATPLLIPLIAIALPAQTNFEFQNMNALLLGITGAGVFLIARNRDLSGGAIVGAAAALKVFPGLLLVYLLVKRRWRAAIAGLVTVALLTALPIIRYGVTGTIHLVSDWIGLRAHGDWFAGIPSNQSILALGERLGLVDVAIAAAAALVIVDLGIALRRTDTSRSDIASELALTLAVAVLVSPIAWDHDWVLMFPICAVAYAFGRSRESRGRVACLGAFWIGAILMTGISRATVGRAGFTWAREHGNSTIAALLLIGAVGAALASPSSSSSRAT